MNIKNILLIGRTGGGKSTLANTLVNQNNNFEEVFKESAGSTSETKQVQIKEFIVNITEDGSERVRYLVIDTAGFGDTKSTDKEVLELMSELARIIGNKRLSNNDYEKFLCVEFSKEHPYPIEKYYPYNQFKVGIKHWGEKVHVDLERFSREALEAQEYEVSSQIERIKQEQRNRENRLYSELESQRRLNEERVAQERQSIQSSLDSTRQNSYDRINQVQQEINNAERNFEQQTQQQVNLPGIVSLIGSFAKLFIGN